MKSLDELKKIRERAKENLRLRESTDVAQIQVSMGTCGIAAGARDVMMALMDELAKRQRTDVVVTQTGCAGLCDREPVITVKLAGESDVVYGDLNAERAREIVANHIVNGQLVSNYVLQVKEG